MEVAGDVHYPDPPLTRLVLGRLKGEVITGGGERRYSFVWGCHVVQMGDHRPLARRRRVGVMSSIEREMGM